MRIYPYTLEELHFAWCHRVYFHFRSHRRKPLQQLARLDQATLSSLLEPYDIQLLELSTDAVNVRLLVSLTATETTSTAASKIKGRLSKWLSDQTPPTSSEKLRHLCRGYFAVTTGGTTSDDVSHYLDRQPAHHGYESRVRPPVFVQRYELAQEQQQQLLEAVHAMTSLRFHLVLASSWRHGVFHRESGSAVAERWCKLQTTLRFLLLKVSIVPDHVHIAVAVHPAVSLATVVVELMNSAQELMWQRYSANVIQAKLDRLWQPSAYVGSFGDLRSPAIAAYVRNWQRSDDDL
ncbi:MAG: IS200/IS605 family transposase [Pirellulaceae bacterium]|nr:IS200/IS605 family transposase [Pirellulaceae bacterium]